MNIDFHDLYKDYSTVDLLKITMHPESYQHAAVIQATEILNTREITQEDIDNAEVHFREEEITAPKSQLFINMFKGIRHDHEKWVNIILAMAVFQYLHLLYIDFKWIDIVLHGNDFPYRIVYLLSYADLLSLPFVFYMFYKRKRWGWIMFFWIKLFTKGPSLLFYYREYVNGQVVDQNPYFLLMTLLDIVILIILWKQDIRTIFKVNDKTKWLTVASAELLLLICLVFSANNYHTAVYSNTGNKIKSVGKRQVATTDAPYPKLLALIANKNHVDTNYMPTGFYFLAEKGKGIRMRDDDSKEIYTISPLPFASVENITATKLEKKHLKNVDYTDLYMAFDSKGTKDIAEGTGNPLHPKIAVIVAGRLLYVVDNTESIKSGIMSVILIGNSDQEMEKVRDAIDNKR